MILKVPLLILQPLLNPCLRVTSFYLPMTGRSWTPERKGDVDGDLRQSRQKRNANRNRMVPWQNKIVPYEFDPGLPSKKKKQLFAENYILNNNIMSSGFLSRDS